MNQTKQEEKMNISQVRERIGKVFHEVYRDQGKRVIVEKSGIVVGGVIGPFDLLRLKRLDERREDFTSMNETLKKNFTDDEDKILENAVEAVRKIRK